MVNCEGSSSIVNSSISGLLTPWCYGNKKGRAWVEDWVPGGMLLRIMPGHRPSHLSPLWLSGGEQFCFTRSFSQDVASSQAQNQWGQLTVD